MKIILGTVQKLSFCYLIRFPLQAPYGAIVMNAKNGEFFTVRSVIQNYTLRVLRNYLRSTSCFSKIENGEISLDEKVEVSRKASAELPAKLGLMPGQKIRARYLIRSTGVMGSNDTSTALAEFVSGSEAEFAELMNLTAKQLGMENSSFLNAHGLTQTGHLSTVRDMAIAFRALYVDFPEYFNLFGRRTSNAV